VGEYGHEFLGYRDGWRGPLERDSRALGVPEVRGILPRGGTILGSSRTNPFKEDGGPERIAENLEADAVDGLIAIGGEDTLGAASRLFEEGVNVVGVPKTIDNDLSATDYTFGFDTAVNIAMSAIDRLHTTAESHRRTLICEVMGRNAGWIALHAGLSGGANVILIPELEFDLDLVTDYIVRRFESQYSPIVVVAEGAKPKGGMPSGDGAPTDSFGHVRLGGIANWLEGEIEQRTGHEARATVLGHVQRGGTPTAFDRVLATRFGLHAIDAAHEGLWGKMAALRSTDIELVDLTEATAELKTVPESLYREAEVFFG
jgi:6-phosphofructokinase 1